MNPGTGFPFSAVTGQVRAKKAALLNLVCPEIGGLLLCGEKGTAKSTILRAASALMPGMTTVNLPLNAGEEGLTGSFDMKEAMKTGRYRYEAGVLARAHKNILYIDEVNLLARGLCSIIVDAASSGFCRIEREGMSETVETGFILFGSMNPEEGGLSPQLLDRFGLFVLVAGETDPEKRTEIIRRRLEFERNPEAFNRGYEPGQALLREKIQKARDLLARVQLPRELLLLAADLSVKINTAGHRGDIVLANTARAIAALDGRPAVSREDILEAAGFAFPHRVMNEQEAPGSNARPGPQGDSNPVRSETAEPESFTRPPAEQPGGDGPARGDGEPDADEIFGIEGRFDVPNPALSPAHGREKNGETGRRGKTRTDMKKGRYISFRQADGKSRDYALDATIRAAVPWQRFRKSGNGLLNIEPGDMKIKIREKRTGNTILFLVDASGSMGAAKRMAETKGAVLSLLRDAYHKRDRVGMMTFRRGKTRLVLNPTRSVDLAHRKLKDLPVGGGTPLALGIRDAVALLKGMAARERELFPLLVLLSDGRGNTPLSAGRKGTQAEVQEEIRKIAEAASHEKIRIMVIDTETGWARLGLAERLAGYLGALYVRLDDCRAESLAAAVRR